LVTHFGSLARIRQASIEEITAVPGIGAATAAAVLEALGTHADPSGSDATTAAVGDDAGQTL
ncbi:MAG: helix-hairpin-helix domain-containing protein, partial [Mycobacterium sp.]